MPVTPGHSPGAALVVACLFYIMGFANISYSIWTKYLTYQVVEASCLFRGFGFVFYALYIFRGGRSYQGAFQALTSSGFGATVACTLILFATWCKHTKVKLWPLPNKAMHYLFLVVGLILPIIAGPALNIVGSGLQYGDLHPHGMHVGIRLRIAGGYTLVALVAILLINSVWAVIQVAVHTTLLAQDGRAFTSNPQSKMHVIGRQLSGDWLVAVIMICVGLQMISASTRIALLYHTTQLLNDHYYYSLIVLPELVEAVILTLPGMLARMGTAGRFPPTHYDIVPPEVHPERDQEAEAQAKAKEEKKAAKERKKEGRGQQWRQQKRTIGSHDRDSPPV